MYYYVAVHVSIRAASECSERHFSLVLRRAKRCIKFPPPRSLRFLGYGMWEDDARNATVSRMGFSIHKVLMTLYGDQFICRT